ncbi:hypothetical protein MPTP_0496 [Melissococcus plutonius ATCC 35311]|uniref:Uncharacterized protein n=1 Tax=Melissococcus plutonius (strain ATCC 35311 / DSM 29964 / CIP 104052 / LMG 20360 / NCIMB 702443) TaxID=940190 RepID=F3Y8Z5_MELPT|nr:hypothetical protein MPTP_0496 [Melissococcus plutonius ATCC 35311]BBD14828.1 hypothetical protein DAT585_0443 [Melissococcus plutonius]BBD17402.1 hypothetical protein DAT606_1495 [Melissococcus plutonius]BBP07958.1 hypothetical protein DAT1033_1495 [Melissococcus plutonius]
MFFVDLSIIPISPPFFFILNLILTLSFLNKNKQIIGKAIQSIGLPYGRSFKDDFEKENRTIKNFIIFLIF